MRVGSDWKPSASLEVLKLRAALLAAIRRFFDVRGFWEVDTPLLSHERAIDLDFAQQALDDLVHASKRPVRLPDILQAVCGVFGVAAEEVQSNSKAASVTMPRMLVMFLARKYTRAALSEISKTLGRKSHSTVVSAQHKVTEWLAEGKVVPLGHSQCKVEDAIKRVEAQLRLA